MRITVQVRPDIAEALHAAPESANELLDLLNSAGATGISMTPLHPGTDDRTLRGYFEIEVTDEELATQLVDALNSSGSVDAAYIKPPEALP